MHRDPDAYALRLFPEVRPIDPAGGNDRGPGPEAPKRSPRDRAVLTENDVVRQLGEKAPRVGLEHRQCRIDATREAVSELDEVSNLGHTTGDAESGALFADPDLARLVTAWPDLSEPIRAAIMALVINTADSP